MKFSLSESRRFIFNTPFSSLSYLTNSRQHCQLTPATILFNHNLFSLVQSVTDSQEKILGSDNVFTRSSAPCDLQRIFVERNHNVRTWVLDGMKLNSRLITKSPNWTG